MRSGVPYGTPLVLHALRLDAYKRLTIFLVKRFLFMASLDVEIKALQITRLPVVMH